MGVQAVLSIVLFFIATAKAADGSVEFWRNEVTLTCPESGTWFDSNGEISNAKLNKTYTFPYSKKARYSCKYTESDENLSEGVERKYDFYVEGKVCENCFELDAELLLAVITADILMTAVVMIIIYSFTKKKSSAGPPQPSKAPPRSGGRAPPVPSPDYERLNPQTRAQDTYSTVVHRMG